MQNHLITPDTAWAFKPAIRNQFLRTHPIHTPDSRLTAVINHANTLRKQRIHSGLPGYVYFLQCHEFTKIGIATHPKSRISSLQVGCPYLLKTLRIVHVPNMLEAEHLLHQAFARFSHTGEWFRIPSQSILPYLACTDSKFIELLENPIV